MSPLDFTFSIICFSETWCDDLDNLIYQIIQVAIKNGVIAKVGECLSTFIILSTSKLDLTFLPAAEILNHLYLRKYVSVLYRQPNGHLEHFQNFLTNFFLNTKNSNKIVNIAGDFNLNLLDHSLNKKVHNSLNLIYQNSFILIVNKPSRVTRKTSTTIDHILTNSSVNTNFKTFIFKIDISDHFPICFLQPTSRPREKNGAT